MMNYSMAQQYNKAPKKLKRQCSYHHQSAATPTAVTARTVCIHGINESANHVSIVIDLVTINYC